LSIRPKLTGAALSCLFFALPLSPPAGAQTGGRRATPAQLTAAREYVRQSWRTLARSNRHLAAAAVDPKFSPTAAGRWPVYLPRGEDPARVGRLLRARMPAEDFARIELRRLPEGAAGEIKEHGLLYLPRPYVVPGGRFNEMYGWDSYFIQVGLLRDGELALARDMVENFLYQVEHYGAVLNANRTYYLTRSQPPFLTRMVLGVYDRTRDRNWLRRAFWSVERYYAFWTRGPRLVPATGLSRYYDSGEGPAPEVVSSERDERGLTHYDRVREFYRERDVKDYEEARYYDAARDELTPLFYKGDRAMRESGFDPSNRFGPFNAAVTSYNPVCLNSLLYVMEKDSARIMRELGRARDARAWERRASERAAKVNRLLWDERDGLYYDYDFERGGVRRYPFVTTFYPLWAGIATPRQAARVVENLPLFERAGGLSTSTNVSGSQWDAPFGWAPMQLIAVEGLRRYGYAREADRVSINFLSLVLKEFVEHNVMVEKYDVERRDSQVSAGIRFGYASNEIGFGWTNAAFTELYAGLRPAARAKVLNLDGVPVPPDSDRKAVNRES
jgi:alpha,alpha-trehalase